MPTAYFVMYKMKSLKINLYIHFLPQPFYISRWNSYVLPKLPRTLRELFPDWTFCTCVPLCWMVFHFSPFYQETRQYFTIIMQEVFIRLMSTSTAQGRSETIVFLIYYFDLAWRLPLLSMSPRFF